MEKIAQRFNAIAVISFALTRKPRFRRKTACLLKCVEKQGRMLQAVIKDILSSSPVPNGVKGSLPLGITLY